MTIRPIRLIAPALLILLGIIWGSGYAIARYCVTHGVPPLGYSFWQSIGPMILLLIASFAQGEKLPITKRYLSYYLVCGILGIALPNTLMYFTAQYIPSGILAVILNTVPILIYPLALLCRQERFAPLRFIAIVIGMIGLMMMVAPHAQTPRLHDIPWTLIILLAPLSFALCAIFIAAYRPVPSQSVTLSAGMLIISSMTVAPLTLITKEFYGFSWPLTTPDLLIIFEVVLSGLGYWILFMLIKRAGPVFYSLVSGVVAIVGLIWGHLLFNEYYNGMSLIAVILILVAIFLISLRQRHVVH